MENGDVSVVGMVEGSHIIEDIGVIVPRGVVVTVPGELALRSKDLYRGMATRSLMKVHRPPANLQVSANESPALEAARVEVARLQEQVAALEARNAVLEVEAARAKGEAGTLRQSLEKLGKLDEILTAIQNIPATTVVQTVAPGMEVGSKPRKEEVVDSSAPIFIPDQIRREGMQASQEVPESKVSSSGVSEAANALKKLKRGKP